MADIYIGNVKGPQGETGATGATGPQGEAATINVGSVSTTAYGNPAQVVNVGTESEAVLNFVIPQGRPGQATTTMGGLTLDTITTSTAEFPSPQVGDTGATAFGKIVKFFSDTLASLTGKLDKANVVNNLTTTESGYALDARAGKTLNDSLLTPSSASGTQITVNSSYVSSSNLRWNRIGNVVAVSGWFRLSAVPAADVNVFKVPNSYHETVVFGYDQNAKNAVCLQLMTSGDVHCVYSNFATGNYINVGFTYITT